MLSRLPIHLYADGADRSGILELYRQPHIRGLTTNPTLMRKAGVTGYEAFCRDVLEVVREKPISFEVLSDDFSEMERQARRIAGWADNVYVKIPITNSRGESAAPLIGALAAEGVRLNVTAMLTLEQLDLVLPRLAVEIPSVVSLFAGRIADTGVDPMPVMRAARARLAGFPRTQLLWASVREVLNLVQAAESGCHIVTVTHDVLARAARHLGQDLTELSLETVRMFARDAEAAGYRL